MTSLKGEISDCGNPVLWLALKSQCLDFSFSVHIFLRVFSSVKQSCPNQSGESWAEWKWTKRIWCYGPNCNLLALMRDLLKQVLVFNCRSRCFVVTLHDLCPQTTPVSRKRRWTFAAEHRWGRPCSAMDPPLISTVSWRLNVPPPFVKPSTLWRAGADSVVVDVPGLGWALSKNSQCLVFLQVTRTNWASDLHRRRWPIEWPLLVTQTHICSGSSSKPPLFSLPRCPYKILSTLGSVHLNLSLPKRQICRGLATFWYIFVLIPEQASTCSFHNSAKKLTAPITAAVLEKRRVQSREDTLM